MNRSLPACAIILLLMASVAAGQQRKVEETFEAVDVIHVHDGDTFRVREADQPIRVYGVDCMELGRSYSYEAWKLTAFALFHPAMGQHRRLTLTVRDIDQFGRYVCEVVLPDGSSLNELLVGTGLARYFGKFAKKAPKTAARLSTLERIAKRMRIGMWSDLQSR